MGAQAGLHTHNAAGPLFKCCNMRKSFDLLAQDALSRLNKAHRMECVFANADANRHEIIKPFFARLLLRFAEIGKA